MRVLVSGAEAKDLAEVVDVLSSNQVEFEYSESGDSILVPEDRRAAMRMELAMKGLTYAVAKWDLKFLTKEILESVILFREQIILVRSKVNWLGLSR